MKILILMLIIVIIFVIVLPAIAFGDYILENDNELTYSSSLYSDKVTRVSPWNLDNSLKMTLFSSQYYNYNYQDVEAIVEAKLSYITRVSSSVIMLSNMISQTVDTGLTYAEDGLTGVIESIATDAITQNSPNSELIIKFYNVSSIANDYNDLQNLKKIAETTENLANLTKKSQTFAVNTLNYILKEEMNYINQNMNNAFKDIWKFNYGSRNHLKIYAVYINKFHQEKNIHEKGIRYFYWNESENAYINYYNNLIFTEVKDSTSEKVNPIYGTWKYIYSNAKLAIDKEKMHYYYENSEGSYLYYNLESFTPDTNTAIIKVYKRKYLNSNYAIAQNLRYKIVVSEDSLYLKRDGTSNYSQWKKVK